ncbi:MAG: response regulator [Fibromonadaceae bacterium]|nr:response regulator [Fibromonadaceae bacterium]
MRSRHSMYLQVLFVFIAFAIIIVSSYFFMSNIEREHLRRDAKEVFRSRQAQITADLSEPKAVLDAVSHNMRRLILQENDKHAALDYMLDISSHLLNDEKRKIFVNGIYVVFDAFDEGYYNSVNWIPPSDYQPRERPWYKMAVEANGNIAATVPYVDLVSNEVIMTYAQRIFNENGEPLAVVCLDILLNSIIENAIVTRLTENSYGMLLNEQLDIMAHPSRSMLGKKMHEVSSEVASLAGKLKRKQSISGADVKNYRGEKTVVSFWRLENGWYLGIMTPKNEYYRGIRLIALILSALGISMAVILSIVLMHLTASRDKTESELRLARDAAEASNRAKSRFLATMSHEIRTPLNVVLGTAEINMQSEVLSPETKEEFERIHHSSDLLLRIINDILDLSKIEAGKLELNPAQYSSISLIQDAVQLNMMRAGSKPIEFKIKVDENIPSELVGDDLRIKQVLSNLLSNAFKYTKSGEVTLSVSAESKYNDFTKLIFSVSDTGQGMTAKQVRGLFNEYSRYNTEANRFIQGAGLGLNIANRLIKLMAGEISVSSKPGKGSTFIVRIPQKVADSKPLGKELAENLQQRKFSNVSQIKKRQIAYENMSYGKILVVDDVEMNLYVAKGLMQPYGLFIDFAHSGFEAIKRVKAGNIYDIIFMDYMMPEMDGIEATKQIREAGYKQPIVALTADAVVGQMEIFLENGFDDFISKPIDIQQLDIILKKMVRDKQSPEIIEEAQRQKTAKLTVPKTDPVLFAYFVQDARKSLAVFEKTLKNIDNATDEDLGLFTVHVHAMRSNLVNIDEKGTAEFAFSLEQAGKERNKNAIRTKTPKLIDILWTIVRKIEAEAKVETAATHDENADYLREQLKVIGEACANYNARTANATLANLKKMSWTCETQALLEQIAEHILYSDFEEANALAKKYGESQK